MPTLAKLTRPRAHRVLLRQGLFGRVDKARERPLVWVSGPPGAGKSTLVASYVGERKCKAAWFHVDAGDDDVGTFFHYLAQAAPARGKRQPPLPQLTAENRMDLPGFSRAFFRQFFDRMPMLVLDNYHELSPASAVHDALDHAIAEVPEGCNIIAVSRAAPPRQIVRHQLAERVSAIDGPALRISLAETRAIAALRHPLDERVVRRIHALSDGWAAGVALSLQRAEQEPAGEQSAGETAGLDDFFEFFARQVLNALPPVRQEFLRVTSLLPRMTAAMADSLTGRDDASEQLEDLYRRGLFTDRRATDPPTYQYHDLFREFLARRHEAVSEPEVVAEQMRRAGALLEQAGAPDHAIRLYLRARDWGAARRAILSNSLALLSQCRNESLRDWIAAFPPEIRNRDPELLMWAGAAVLRLEPLAARELLLAAFEGFKAAGALAGQTLACTGLIRSFMYEFSDMRPLDTWIDELLALRERVPVLPSPTAELYVNTALLFALSSRRPRKPVIDDCIQRTLALLPQGVPSDAAAMACGVIMVHLYRAGEAETAARIGAKLQGLMGQQDVLPITRALGEIQIGRFHYELNDLAASEAAFRRSLAIISENALTLPVVNVYARLGLAFCLLERGDVAGAEAERRRMEEYSLPGRRIDAFVGSRLQLLLACRSGDWGRALESARSQIRDAAECGMFWFIFESWVQCALICAELDREAEFEDCLRPLESLLAGTGYEHLIYQAEFARAYLALRRGERAAGLALLRSGLPKSRRDGGMVNLRRHPGLLERLLSEALVEGIETDYVRNSIRQLHLRPPERDLPQWPWPIRVHTLGRFELKRDDQPVEYSRKAPRKTLALLKAIVAFGGSGVREQRLMDAFWSDEEGDVAAKSLGAAVQRLRALLGDGEAVVQQGGKLSLDDSRVWVDAWAFEALVARPGPADPGKLLALYRGAFLAEDEDEPWSVTMRERLRGRFVHAVAEAGASLEAAGLWHEAIECYLRGLDADPVIEQFYQGLMRAYAGLDRMTEALAAYQRMKRLLSISLGVRPSAQSERLYQGLKLGS